MHQYSCVKRLIHDINTIKHIINPELKIPQLLSIDYEILSINIHNGEGCHASGCGVVLVLSVAHTLQRLQVPRSIPAHDKGFCTQLNVDLYQS